ncbi:sensor histidine kinase [Fodinicola feengrottensis]|uniref:sensor histidine kinase n=1 Tax=Fodinicola feengrottensis TaxID=435914 RepID=UPI0013D74544|nr:ATP-binding protein [Fodinicola feengrottensis]
MRRNAENLIILGGGAPGRQWRQPVPLVDVIRSAAAEVGGYSRVRVLPIGDGALNGSAVSDLTHLLSELIDNAVSFSPPHTQVQVTGQLVPKGFVVEIEDRGLGMQGDEMTAANRYFANPPEFNVLAISDNSRLGMFVVARLAARHNVHVSSLRSSPYGGTSAIVLIPSNLISTSAGADRAPAEPKALVGAVSGSGHNGYGDPAASVGTLSELEAAPSGGPAQGSGGSTGGPPNGFTLTSAPDPYAQGEPDDRVTGGTIDSGFSTAGSLGRRRTCTTRAPRMSGSPVAPSTTATTRPASTRTPPARWRRRLGPPGRRRCRTCRRSPSRPRLRHTARRSRRRWISATATAPRRSIGPSSSRLYDPTTSPTTCWNDGPAGRTGCHRDRRRRGRPPPSCRSRPRRWSRCPRLARPACHRPRRPGRIRRAHPPADIRRVGRPAPTRAVRLVRTRVRRPARSRQLTSRRTHAAPCRARRPPCRLRRPSHRAASHRAASHPAGRRRHLPRQKPCHRRRTRNGSLPSQWLHPSRQRPARRRVVRWASPAPRSRLTLCSRLTPCSQLTQCAR